uniref:CHK kinase-like domain-containing protein n=1 Tax=Panagrolaimus sp. JU765 TaxID=591449 RepID=A0AC34QKM4_9BILA
MNAKTEIGQSGFSIGFVLEKLRDSGQTNCVLENLHSFESNDITGGAAFFSEIYSVKFNWKFGIKPERVVLKASFFFSNLKVENLKIPKLIGVEHLRKTNDDPEFMEVVKEKFAKHLERAHKLEGRVYNFYAHTSEKLKLPEFYYSSPYKHDANTGIIMMEDLTQWAKTVKLIPGFDNQQIENLFDELAKLHSVSLQDRSWTKAPEFVELPPANLFLQEMIEVIKKLLIIDEKRFHDLVPKIIKFCNEKTFYNAFHDDDKFGFPTILVHGDLWSSNVLWKIDSCGNSTSELAAIIDWQMAAQGNPGIDLSRALAMNTSAKYRRENTDRLLKFYLEKLEKYLGKPPPMNFSQLKNAYNYSLGFCAVFIGYGTPSYYNMESIVGDPADDSVKEELLERCSAILEDMLQRQITGILDKVDIRLHS